MRRLLARFCDAHGPTWLVAVVVYGGWAAATLGHRHLPLPLLAVIGGALLALHGSLQHETIHGHPAGPRWVGAVLAFPPLSLWLPYAIYRETHRRHHATPHLTDPLHDPESPFRHERDWGAMSGPHRALTVMERTLLGRLCLGPFAMIVRFLASEAAVLSRGEPTRRRTWLVHGVAVAAIAGWVVGVAQMPITTYLLAFVIPGASLTLLRSLAEHRPEADPKRRTAVVETNALFRLLFLNNNLHVTHHRHPRAPWFTLPGLWKAERAAMMKTAPDLVIDGYLDLARAHGVRPITPVTLQPPSRCGRATR